MHARARVMGEIEEVQERMKDDMEAMMSMKKIMEVNAAAVAATSAVARVDPIPPSSLNQINYPTLDMVGQGGQKLGSTGGPHFVQVQNKHAFLPYGLPPNYTPPNVSHTPDENFNNSTPILVEIQQPQFDHAHVSQPMGKTHEIPHHNLADFKPRLGYAIEGQAIGGGPLPNTSEHPPFRPQPQPLHFAVGRVPPAMAGKGKIEVGLKRGEFDYPALTNKKPGANREDEKEEGTHAVTVALTWPNFPPAQQCHYSANISPSHYPPSNQPQSLPAAHPIPNSTLNTNQNTN
ncbi:hypothetical protein GmHk_19G054912 [Glycine max]|nr:hypothetical protein GmHk_19G054912 [Glycine max]